MKYYAYATENGETAPDYFAEVRGDGEVSYSLALRQARAMRAVLLAARAWAKAYELSGSLWDADKQLLTALARLKEIEGKVARG